MITPLRTTDLLPGTLENLYYPPPDYPYFRCGSTLNVPTADLIPKAAIAVDAAILVYARKGATRMTDDELKANFQRLGLDCQTIGSNPADWNAPGTQAVFASSADYAICAFRGTERDDPQDILIDADATLKPEPDYRPVAHDPAPALGPLHFITHLFSTPSVHQGFQKALNEVWEQVHTLVTAYRASHPQKEILFTGHSLGGALAVLAYSRFADPDISLYTFGCPRVGDAAFRDRLLQNPGRGIYRFVNFNDAVTHVPTSSLFYCQIPDSSLRFDAQGNLNPDDGSFKGDLRSLSAAVFGLPKMIDLHNLHQLDAPPSLVDHSPGRYGYRLWDCVANPCAALP